MRAASPLTAIGDRTFGSLRRHREFRLYFAGTGVSFVGVWIQQIAAFWLILQLTGSAVAVGALALVQTLPITVLSLVGGSIADRVDVRRMVLACETVLLVQATVLCVLAASGRIEAWQLYALGLVRGVAFAINAPARHTLVFRTVGREALTNAIALSASLGTSARILGPAIGGVVLAAFGTAAAFGLNALSCLAGIAAILAMRLEARPPQTDGPRHGLLGGIGETLRFAVSSRRVAVVFFSLLLVSTFAFNFDVLLPLVAGLTLDEGPSTYGLIAAVFGAGALTGALTLATIGKARVLFVLGGALGFGLLQLVLAQQDTVPAVCVLLYLAGIFYILWGSSSLATLQLAAPEHMRARAASLYFFGFMGGAPLGGLIAGTLTEHGGTRLAFTVAGTIAVVVVAVGATVLAASRSRSVTGSQTTQEAEA